MSALNNIILVAVGILLTVASIWYGQNHHLLPASAADSAPLFDSLFNSTITVATGIFLIVQGVLIYSAIRYRKRRGDEGDGAPDHGNVLLEIVWTAVPAIIILWLGVASLDVYQAINSGVDAGGHAHSGMAMAMEESSYEAKDPSYAYTPVVVSGGEVGQPDLVVQVQGMQYAWVFTYPESGLVASELHLPLNKRVRLDMTALDVNHAFWVPQFRLKQDVIPGRETHLEFVPSKLGEYPIVCAELCGPYHGVMGGQLFVDTPEAFASWQEEQILAARSDGSTLALAPEVQPESAFAKAQHHRLGIPEDIHVLHRQFGSQSSG
ncbi:cytochrome c oxidase subunit II [Thermostichus vulcanus]|uniref:Cytochrome c oxidase subunit 2 n=1 Tax=Thermostichus vulcanus str. 'Rupite' TaxID=2813851 RepID=A0ABT0CD75_THEVL|nr:cytochrome c oxidase subunit II [Thermostichus vulcanus str. 'Rupite']